MSPDLAQHSLYLATCLVLLAGCARPSAGIPKAERDHLAEEIASAPVPAATFSIPPAVAAIALTEASSGRIVVARGDGGLDLYDLTGTLIWHGGSPAVALASEPRRILAYDRADGTSLTRYVIREDALVVSGPVERPSPIAPTTLLRATYAALGPIRFEGEVVRTPHAAWAFSSEVRGLAASRASMPGFEGGLVAVALDTGTVELHRLDALSGPRAQR